MAQAHEEAELERRILRALGGDRDLLLLKNEVGVGYPCHELHASMEVALRGDPALGIVKGVLTRARRVQYGLGVGSPDLVGAVGGRFIGMELKSPTGRLSAEQARWMEAANGRGIHLAVVREVTQAREFIEKIRNK